MQVFFVRNGDNSLDIVKHYVLGKSLKNEAAVAFAPRARCNPATNGYHSSGGSQSQLVEPAVDETARRTDCYVMNESPSPMRRLRPLKYNHPHPRRNASGHSSCASLMSGNELSNTAQQHRSAATHDDCADQRRSATDAIEHIGRDKLAA